MYSSACWSVGLLVGVGVGVDGPAVGVRVGVIVGVRVGVGVGVDGPAVGVRVGVRVGVGDAVTVKLLALFTPPPGVITVITPLVAPEGTVAVI